MRTPTRTKILLAAGLSVALHAGGVARAATGIATGTAAAPPGTMIPVDLVAGGLGGHMFMVLMALHVGRCARHGHARRTAAATCVALVLGGVADGVFAGVFLWAGVPLDFAVILLVGGAVLVTTAVTLRADVRRNFGVIPLRKMQAMDAA